MNVRAKEFTRARVIRCYSQREREREIRNERKRERERGGDEEDETFFFSLLFSTVKNVVSFLF